MKGYPVTNKKKEPLLHERKGLFVLLLQMHLEVESYSNPEYSGVQDSQILTEIICRDSQFFLQGVCGIGDVERIGR